MAMRVEVLPCRLQYLNHGEPVGQPVEVTVVDILPGNPPTIVYLLESNQQLCYEKLGREIRLYSLFKFTPGTMILHGGPKGRPS